MITETDLIIEYRRDVGGDEIDYNDFNKWVKEQLLFLRNALGITETILNDFKKLKRTKS